MSDIEIIDIDDHPIPTSNGKFLSMLQDSSDEDQDIICLDTVFKPVQRTEKTTKEQEVSYPESNSNVSLIPTNINKTISQSATSQTGLNTVYPEPETSNYFSTDEDSIDDILVKVPANQELSQTNFINLPLVNPHEPPKKCEVESLAKVSCKNDTQRELHIPPSHSREESNYTIYPAANSSIEPLSKRVKVQSAISLHKNIENEYLLNDEQINPQACTFPKPFGTTFIDLIVVILKNCKCLLFGEIWDYITGLFPYFEYHFTVQQGVEKIRKITHKAPSFFLRTPSGVGIIKQSKHLLIMLNPVTRKEQHMVMTNLLAKRETIMKSMYVPECFDSLAAGTLPLNSIKLFRLRKRPVSGRTRSAGNIQDYSSSDSVHSQEANSNSNSPLPPQEPEASTSNVSNSCSKQSNTIYENMPSAQTEEQELDRVNASSPTSNSSTDTIVFDPKIINCRSINHGDLLDSDMFAYDSNVDEGIGANGKEFQGGAFRDLTSNLLNQLDTWPFSSDTLGSNNAFANTVWTSDETLSQQHNKGKKNVDCLSSDPKSSINAPSFPEVEQCIPKWKQIFPWISWKPWLKKICCDTCGAIHHSVNSRQRIDVVEILHPDDVFKVSKQLRDHSDKTSHKMAVILQNKNIIFSIYFLINSHFNEFNSISEILAILEDMVGKKNLINQDILKCVLSMLGQYLEDKILTSLKKTRKFSVITDPCAGLLIVRWLNDTNEPEEHVISSFCSVNNKTPSEYLASLGVNLKYMVSYITNARCEECNRCRLTKKVMYKSSTPLRLPQLDRYLVFLWRRKLMKPFYSLGSSLCKLWLSFPHKFIEMGKVISLDKLSKFPSNPDTFIEVFHHFEKFKEIAASVYTLTGSLEALGLQKIDISKYSWMLDLFPILTNINILLMEIKMMNPFMKDFDNLCHHVEKLQSLCEKLKGDLREEKIQASVNAVDIDEIFDVVQMTAKEFQQPIYYKGRSVTVAYNRMTLAKNLDDCATNSVLQNTFTVLFTAIKCHYRYCDLALNKSLSIFLKENKQFERKNANVVLEYFQKNKEYAKDQNILVAFYKIMAILPFQPAKVERCLYEIKIYDYLFYRSAWAGIGPSVKDYLLTIISELQKQLLSQKDMCQWWKDKIAK